MHWILVEWTWNLSQYLAVIASHLIFCHLRDCCHYQSLKPWLNEMLQRKEQEKIEGQMVTRTNIGWDQKDKELWRKRTSEGWKSQLFCTGTKDSQENAGICSLNSMLQDLTSTSLKLIPCMFLVTCTCICIFVQIIHLMSIISRISNIFDQNNTYFFLKS